MTTQNNPYSVSVAAAVVNDDQRILLVQRRDNGRWEPPGGILERGETIANGLQREVREETGLHVNPGPLTGVYQNMAQHVVALVFRCTVEMGTLTTNSEVAAFYWASRHEIEELTTETFRVRLSDALQPQGVNQTPIRYHDGRRLLQP